MSKKNVIRNAAIIGTGVLALGAAELNAQSKDSTKVTRKDYHNHQVFYNDSTRAQEEMDVAVYVTENPFVNRNLNDFGDFSVVHDGDESIITYGEEMLSSFRVNTQDFLSNKDNPKALRDMVSGKT